MLNNHRKKTAVIGFLGTTLDNGFSQNRWQRWRPTISLCMHEHLLIDELYLLHDNQSQRLFQLICDDVAVVSPQTSVFSVHCPSDDAWDFAEVYQKLSDFCENFHFQNDVQYYVHLTTGTHVAQICWFLLINNHFLPAKIVQTSPAYRDNGNVAGKIHEIDLDLSRYDNLTANFLAKQQANLQTLKHNIATQNPNYNQLIEQIEKVANRSTAPILLIGATGAGKSKLAKQLYEIKRQSGQVSGNFIDVNCATLRGDTASSMLFGHVKGAFTGANYQREGLLKQADNGLLFLDEIGELGLDEQAMLLTALETGEFYPVGSDKPVKTKLQLMAGTNKDLRQAVQQGQFREDLFSRLNTWTFFLPSLRERLQDLPANIDYELQRLGNLAKVKYRFANNALQLYLNFAKSEQAIWSGNFRDLNASMLRMTTLADDNQIDLANVQIEIERLTALWQTDVNPAVENCQDDVLTQYLSNEKIAELDEFDKLQLVNVIEFCQKYKRQGKNQAEVGRLLFAKSREKLKKPNDSDRLRKYLLKFGLMFDDL